MKKIRQSLAAFFAIITLISGTIMPVQALSGDTEVYITKTGECYHKKNCRTIKRSKTKKKVTLEKAVKQGLRPCKVCKPGELSEGYDYDSDSDGYLTTPVAGFSLSKTVYISKSGKIHKKSNCSGMKKYTKMTYEEACELGYEHCKKCFKHS